MPEKNSLGTREYAINNLPDEFLKNSPNNKPAKLNQQKLKTGDESLRQGEPHPRFPFLVLLNTVNCMRGECWGTLDQWKRKNRTDQAKPKPKTLTKTCDHCKKEFKIDLVHGALKFKKRCSEECYRAATTLRARKRREKKHKVSAGRRSSWERSKEQTGQEKGTFKFGDKHPTDPNYFYWGWRENIPKYRNSPEKWVPKETYEREIARRERAKKERQEKSEFTQRVKKVKSLQLGTNPESTKRLVYGTIHPNDDNWIFHGYRHGVEKWVPKDEFKTNHQSSVEYHRDKRSNDLNYVENQRKEAKIYRRLNPGITGTHNVLDRTPELKEQINSITDEEQKEINQIYLHAVRISERIGIPFAVDHTKPISLGGLHIPSNLQVVPRKWNILKSNHHSEAWPFPFNRNAEDPNSKINYKYKVIDFND